MIIKRLKNQIVNNYRTNKWYKQNVIVVLICLVLLSSLSIGYAILSQNLNISGEAALRASNDIRITKIENTNISCGYDVYYPKYDLNSITVNLELPNLECTVEYEVTIKNYGTKDMKLVEIIEDSYNNNDIEYEMDGIGIDDIVEASDTLVITITFKYKGSVVTLPSKTDLGAIIKFEFEEAATSQLLNEYIMDLVSNSNVTGVYNEPVTDYRYEKANVNNYVLFNNEL